MSCLFTLLVTSLINTVANLFALKLLCTHKKLISAILIFLPLTTQSIGIPEMKPKSLFFLPPLTPNSHSL